MELRRVSVEDVYPDDKNPRKDFGDIEAMAESFMLNALNPGEPVNPIVTVADGGIYRIVDGERRYRAMRHNKLYECHAVVCDDMDEANALVAMLATDDKRQLSDIERSQGVQQMLLLGVDPEKVERTARLKKGCAAKAAKAMSVIDDAAEDMTLDHLFAIAEFEDDPDAIREIEQCRASDLDWKVRSLQSSRKRRETLKEIERICSAAGVEIADSAELRCYSFAESLRLDDFDPKELEDSLKAHMETGLHEDVKVDVSGSGIYYYIRTKDAATGNEGPDPEEEARKAERQRLTAIARLDDERRIKWLAENLGESENCRLALAEIVTWPDGNLDIFDPSDFNQAHGTAIEAEITPYTFALMAEYLPTPWPEYIPGAIKSPDPDDCEQRALAMLLAALQMDGYELSEAETAFAEAFAEKCGQSGFEDEENR